MELEPLGIHGAWLIHSKIHADSRGSFQEWFKTSNLANLDLSFNVLQANISESKRGTIRGIHYSLATPGQSKWVTCMTGEIRDVIVDLRTNSNTFGKYVAVDLVAKDRKSVLIEGGLGHGFAAKIENTLVAYLLSAEYSPEEEFELNPLDPMLGIEWGVEKNDIKMSPKDSAAPSLEVRRIQNKLPNTTLSVVETRGEFTEK